MIMIEIVDYIDYFFAVLVVVFGIVVTKEDMYRGKIRNAVIGTGLVIGFLGYVGVFVLMYAAQMPEISPSYFLHVGMNFIISVLCGYLLWHYKLWSAGDAKFFMLLSFLLPLRFYANGYLLYFPSLALVINIFVPIFLFLLVRMMVEIAMHFKRFIADEAGVMGERYQRIRQELASTVKHKKRILIFAGTFLLTFLFIPLLKYQTIPALSLSFGGVLAIFFGFYLLQGYLRLIIAVFLKSKWFVNGTLVFIAGYFILGFLYFPDLLTTALIMTVKVGVMFFAILKILERFSSFYIKRKEVVVVEVEDLRPGMVISDELVKNIQSDDDLSHVLGELYPEGISKEQVPLLKKWFLEHDKKNIPIYKTFSFAPYIFAGAIITMIAKQSIEHLVLSFMK